MRVTARVVVDVSGLHAIQEVTRQRAITLKAVRAGSKIVLRAMRAAAPKSSGAIRKAQGVKAKKGTLGKTQSFAVIGSRRKWSRLVKRAGRRTATLAVPAFYDHLIRGGTKPHSVSKGQRLGRTAIVVKRKNGYRTIGKDVERSDQSGKQHPGTKANEFRLRAWESSQREAGAAALAVLAEETNAAIAAQASATLAKLGGRS